MLFDVEPDQFPNRADCIERVQIKPLMFEHAPPGLDERIGKRDLRHGQKPIQEAGLDQLIDRYIEVLDTSVDQHRRFGVGQIPRGVEKELGGRGRVERGRYFPGQNAAREVVDDCMEVSSTSIEKANQRRIDMPNLVKQFSRTCGKRTYGSSSPGLLLHGSR